MHYTSGGSSLRANGARPHHLFTWKCNNLDQGWGSKSKSKSIIEKIEIFYEIENKKKSKSKKNWKIDNRKIKKIEIEIEIEKRISINKFLLSKTF